MQWTTTLLVKLAVSRVILAYRPEVDDTGSPSSARRPAQERGSGLMAVQVWSSANMRWASHGLQEKRKQATEPHQHMSAAKGAPLSISLEASARPWRPQPEPFTDLGGPSQSQAEIASMASAAGSRETGSRHQEEHHEGPYQGSVERVVSPWNAEWIPEVQRAEESSHLDAAAEDAAAAVSEASPPLQNPLASAGYSASDGNETGTGSPRPRGTSLPDAAKLDVLNAGRLIFRALVEEDARALRSYLEVAGVMLEAQREAFDPNARLPLAGGGGDEEELRPEGDLVVLGGDREAKAQQPSPKANETTTLLAYVARSGCMPGVDELLDWDRSRVDQGERIRVDDPGNTEGPYAATPFLLSVQAGHAGVAARLLQSRASVAVKDEKGRTPLELAAYSGSWELAAALLESGSPLSGGLMSIRVKLQAEGEHLPKIEGRWLQATLHEDSLGHLRSFVPQAFRPSADEEDIVGGLPASWVLLYKNRVMCAFSEGVISRGKPAYRTQKLLADHNFDSFARDFSLSFVVLSCMLGFFGILTHVAFRIRLYGWCETPVSLVDFIPGAFDPLRLVDPDFDPARQKARLPYLAAKEYLGPHASSCLLVLATFVQALLGVFSAWLLLCVRIPPEKDPYDEDYLSDDDEDSRARVRKQCLAKAARVRWLEVSVRSLALATLMLWLVCRQRRCGEAMVLALLHVYYAWLAGSVASSTQPSQPAQEPEKTPNGSREEALDAARVVQALFSVQHGPRWTRAICSTRSTAAPSGSTKARWLRRRNRRQHQNGGHQANGADTDRSGSEVGPRDALAATAGEAPNILEADETAFSDWFQRTFLQFGLLHVSHGALLANSLISIALISSSLLWLPHGRRLWGEGASMYAWVSPTQLFQAYGVPGTWERCVAILLEMLMLFFAGERIYGMAGLVHVAALTMEQRRAALHFARQHQPGICRKSASEALGARGTSIVVDECVRCFDFALELSAVRWAVLREPVLVLYLFTLKFLLAALVLLAMPLAKPISTSWMWSWCALDPMVPLLVGLCLAWPLLGLLFTASSANYEVAHQREHIKQATESAVALAVTAGKEADDVQYVQLRVKASDALRNSFIQWPGGRTLGLFEPVLLLVLLAGTFGLAFAVGLWA